MCMNKNLPESMYDLLVTTKHLKVNNLNSVQIRITFRAIITITQRSPKAAHLISRKVTLLLYAQGFPNYLGHMSVTDQEFKKS